MWGIHWMPLSCNQIVFVLFVNRCCCYCGGFFLTFHTQNSFMCDACICGRESEWTNERTYVSTYKRTNKRMYERSERSNGRRKFQFQSLKLHTRWRIGFAFYRDGTVSIHRIDGAPIFIFIAFFLFDFTSNSFCSLSSSWMCTVNVSRGMFIAVYSTVFLLYSSDWTLTRFDSIQFIRNMCFILSHQRWRHVHRVRKRFEKISYSICRNKAKMQLRTNLFIFLSFVFHLFCNAAIWSITKKIPTT